ncbi:MAG: TIM barrel protein [Planctomycetaceae bacterium]
MRRRTFLSASAAAVLSARLARPLFALPPDSRYMKTIGLQLWTVRNQLEKDVPGTLKAVATAGYRQAELMNVLQSDDIIRAAHDAGLDVESAFVDWQSVGNPNAADAPSFDTILEKAKAKNLKYLVFGYIGKGHRETVDHFKGHAERANAAGQKCRDAGIQLCYHNHSFEFTELQDSKTGFDVLMDEFDRELVKFEVDVFWVKIGGWDPIATMKRLNGRVAQVHLKDLKAGTEVLHDEGQVPHDAFRELGAGTIDMAEVIKVAAETGAALCHVEQDQSPDPIASIGQSMQHLRKI